MVYAYTKSEARKLPEVKTKPPSLFDETVSFRNWYRFVNWPQSILLLGTPLIALYGMTTTELQTKTLLWSILYYFITGMSITGGKKSIVIQ
jgi:stearoyl-CoA desaturase (delta-9 desaturase)